VTNKDLRHRGNIHQKAVAPEHLRVDRMADDMYRQAMESGPHQEVPRQNGGTMPEDSENYIVALMGLEVAGLFLEDMTEDMPNLSTSIRGIITKVKTLGVSRKEVETALITDSVSEVFQVYVRFVLDEVFTD
jgi:hypothetical protein